MTTSAKVPEGLMLKKKNSDDIHVKGSVRVVGRRNDNLFCAKGYRTYSSKHTKVDRVHLKIKNVPGLILFRPKLYLDNNRFYFFHAIKLIKEQRHLRYALHNTVVLRQMGWLLGNDLDKSDLRPAAQYQ